jgi:tetratricopeptide (TPR) repeat protein
MSRGGARPDQIETQLGLAHQDQVRGRLASARERLVRALRAARIAFGRRHPLVAEIHNQLGIVGKYDGRFSDAERHYRAALGILRGTRRRGRLELADLYHNLGGLEHARGRYARGEPLARRAAPLRARQHGANATVVWLDRTAHAALLDGLGRYAESEPVYRRALTIFRRRLGKDHYEVAVTLNNLGCQRAKRGDAATAAKLLRESLILKRRLLGPRHADVAMTQHNLARVLAELGQVRQARRMSGQAVATLRKTLGPDHPTTRRCAAGI